MFAKRSEMFLVCSTCNQGLTAGNLAARNHAVGQQMAGQRSKGPNSGVDIGLYITCLYFTA